VPGSGITAQEQYQLNKQRNQLNAKQAQMMSDGRLDRHERKQLEQRQQKLNQKEWKDRRD
jgi:hypothetical protein